MPKEFQARTHRASLLIEADHKINEFEDTNKDSSKWRTYRHELREVTKQKGFPDKIKWPVKPGN